MALEVNKELIDYIRKSDYDKTTQDFLIQALRLEFRKDKLQLKHYFDDYDKIIENFIE